MTPDVEVADLGHDYAATRALDGVSFTVPAGETFGVLGPDGAGKTTLFRILVTLLVPHRGGARVLGHDVVTDLWALRRRLGYMPGRFALYPDLTVAENLAFHAAVFGTTVAAGMAGIRPIYDQLAPFAARRASALSGGMKQKLALCCALVHAPDLLILDEPTTGVDAVSRAEFWDLLGSLREGGLTILVATPYMDEATRCDRVLLLQGGRVLALDRPAALAAGYPRALAAVRAADRLGLLCVLRADPAVATAWPFGETVHATAAASDVAPAAFAASVAARASASGLSGVTAAPIAAGIEDVFMWRLAEGPGAGATGSR